MNYFDEKRIVLATLAVGATTAISWYYFSKWMRLREMENILEKEWEEVGHVSRLLIYPLKSAKPIPVETAMATKAGLAKGNLADRSFVIFTEDWNLVTGRQCYKLVTISTSFENDNLTMTSLNGEKVTVNILDTVNNNGKIIKMKIRGDLVQGIDCGDNVAEWLSKELYEDGTKVRLLYAGLQKWSRAQRDFNFDFPGYKEDDTPVYNDSGAYMVMTESSLQDLNNRISSPTSMAFFRPPIVVAGTVPYDEDTWEYIKIGDNVVLHLIKPCERCKLTTVDPESGTIKKEHFDALLSYRTPKYPPKLASLWQSKPIFGLHCGIDITGKISTGDKVYVSRSKSPYWHV